MPRVTWPLLFEQPRIQIEVCLPDGTSLATRDLVADTGAGAANATFDLLLHVDDCRYCRGKPVGPIPLHGAYAGTFPVYLVRVLIPPLAFDQVVPVVAIQAVPIGFDGIAGFRFLNRFGYGNFGAPDQFGLER